MGLLNSNTMFNKSKILKKKDEKPTDLDEEVSKNLSSLEQKGEVSLKGVFINSTESVEYKREDGTMGTYRLIRIPHRSLEKFTKVCSKPVPRLALRMCSHLLLQMSTPGRVAADGLRREDCTFFATDDRDELEALDDHTMQHNHKSRDAAGISLCGVVHDVLAAHPKTLTVVATAPEEMHAATVKTECEAFFSHQGGTHYSTFKQAFVFNNKVDL